MKLHGNRKNRKKLLQRAFSLLIVLSLIFSAGSTNAANAEALDSANSYEERLICGLEENGHVHDDVCYTEQQILICGMEGQDGHAHTDECYSLEKTLICGLEEHNHVHTAECYKKVLVYDGDAVEGNPAILEDGTVQNTGESPSGTEQGGMPGEETAGTEQGGNPEEDAAVVDEDGKPEGDSTIDAGTVDTEANGGPEAGTTSTEADDKPDEDTANTETDDEPDEDTANTETDGKPEDDVADTETDGKPEDDVADTETDGKPEDDAVDTEQDSTSDETEELTEEELLRVTEVNELIAAAPSQEEIAASLAGFEADRDAWYACHEELRAQMMEACSAYLELDGKLRGQIEGIEGLLRSMELRREIETDFLERPAYCGKVSHIHLNLEGCYDEEDNIVCEDEQHEHWGAMACYDENGNLVCEIEEHIHDGECFRIPGTTEEEQAAIEQVSRWIADLPKEDEIYERLAALEEEDNEEEYAAYVTALRTQVQKAYDAYQALGEELQKHVVGAEYLLALQAVMEEIILDDSGTADNLPEWAAAIPVEGSDKGKMVMELLYGDRKHHNEKDAEIKSPHWEQNGYFNLYTKDIEGNLKMEDLTITFHFPKEHIDPNTIGFIPFTEPQHSISDVEENGNYYDISITFPKYMQTGQIQYEFHMRFYGGIVPKDYELGVYATISCGGKSADTAENIYKPTYEIPKIVKYVNTNQYDSMSKDYTRVSASVGEDGVIADNSYVSFWYKMGGDKWFFREYDQVTLTDTLPTYTKYVRDEDGKIVTDAEGNKVTETAIAQFDVDANPGWVIAEDGKTVSCVLTTDKSCKISPKKGEDSQHWRAANELEKKIQETELKLKFPDCVIDEDAADGFLKKDLKNKIEADFHPNTPSEGETDDIVKDDLIFTLTNQPVGAGFAKYNSSNVVMDTKMVRESLYRWGIRFENSESVVPLVNLKVTDYELDERLKIHTLRLITEKKSEYQAENRIEKIEVLKYDGGRDIYQADSENPGIWFGEQKYDGSLSQYYQELILKPGEEYKGFTVYMKDGYKLKLGENIHIGVYTTFREPDKQHYIQTDTSGDPRNAYVNKAKTEYQVEEGASDKFYTVYSENQFSMIDTTENISIQKSVLDEQVALGDKNKYWDIRIKGSLMDGKNYEDMRIIDLLPEAFTLPTNGNGEMEVRFGQNGQCVKESSIIPNYKNTGRTAVILYLDVDKVKAILDAPPQDALGNTMDYVSMTLITDVLPDANVGTFTNEVWLLSDDFEPITTQASAPDIYDLDDDGNKMEEIRKGTASCIVKSPTGVYAEKLIAPAEFNTWRKTGLTLGVGDAFRYKLCVINAAENEHRGLLIYDVLPTIGDPNISNNGTRGSEYRVKLSARIMPPDGYGVYYTTSDQVYSKSMTAILGDGSSESSSEVEWLESDRVTDEILAQVTAFKIVAESESATIPAKGRVEFEIPVKVSDVLDDASYKILETKESTDRGQGTATYLVSTNSFGYRVQTFSGSNLESNYVKAQIPFAGFVIKKVDAENPETVLSGAEFRLERQQDSAVNENTGETISSNAGDGAESGTEEGTWETIAENVVSGADGILSFKNLTEGTYRLTETRAPQGYMSLNEPIIVTVTLDRETMEYRISIADNEYAGNSRDPFLIENRKEVFYELPSTGGAGTRTYTAAGILLMMASGLYMLCGRKKSRA